ncbi:hypothetical protein M2T93_23625, partial [Klebsiella pneumoniae]|nr:hypothetical protein [Klebsiella pneumoniae]
PVGDFELLLCHGTVCVVGKIRDLILQLSKSSIYSTKPVINNNPVNSLAFRAAAPADNKLEQHAFAHARDYERYLD